MIRRPQFLIHGRFQNALFLVILCFGVAMAFGTAALQTDENRPAQPVTAEPSLVGVVVQFEDAPLARYTGGISGLKATSPKVSGTKRLNVRSPESQRYVQYLDSKMQAFEQTATSSIPGTKVGYRYQTVLGGVSMKVPADRMKDLAALPGVKAVYPDRLRKRDTDSSPRFMGAEKFWNKVGGQGNAGEGIIVGVIDTGVWPEHPSFADPDPAGAAYPAVPAHWTPGAPFCEAPSDGTTTLTCNNKLVGARKFLDTYKLNIGLGPLEFDSPRDSDGHGTHTASTAAGNGGVEASVLGTTIGTVSGIAPRAHVAVYKALGFEGGYDSDLVAAINQAVSDGVDVINYSIGPTSSFLEDPYTSADDLAFLDAYDAGVFVATSAGNSGPDADTVNHLGGWTTTVAASTEARSFRSTITLSGGRKRLRLTGDSITPGVSVSTPVVLAANYSDEYCENPFTPGTFSGQIVVCRRGINARVAKGYNVLQGGASGMILYNPTLQGTTPDNHFLPTVHLEEDAGAALLAFLAANPGTTATFSDGKRTRARGDVMASFSSRGGAGQTYGISKPDITAPGVAILAGNTELPDDVAGGPLGELFQALQGTSMASPHIAGSGALLKQLHPDWTPGQIKSALMTTATTRRLFKEDGVTLSDSFDRGTGRVDLSRAGSPGITFDVPAAEYLTHQTDLWNVNYPSIYVPQLAGSVTVQRTAHSVVATATRWSLRVAAPSDLVIVVPPSITVPAGGDTPFDVTINASGVPVGEVRQASLTLRSGATVAVIPITIVRAP